MKILIKLLGLLLILALVLLIFTPSWGMIFAAVSAVSIGIMLLFGLLGFWIVDKVNRKNAQSSTLSIWIARILLLACLIAPPANGYKSLILFALYFGFVYWHRKRQRNT